MAEKTVMTAYGRVHLFKNNPREMRDSQFQRLTESVRDKEKFLQLQEIIIWQVPDQLDVEEGEKCPFLGQEGQLITISGNMRIRSMMALGKKEIPKEYVKLAKIDGEWINWRDAEWFSTVANSPTGMAGDFDYDKLKDRFDEWRLRLAGIDFANFAQKEEDQNPTEDEIADGIEQGEHGENNEQLEDFKKEREKTRKDVHEIDEYGFYLVLVFATLEDRSKFIAEAGLADNKKRVAMTDDGTMLVLVFESFDQKMDFIAKAGLRMDPGENGEEPQVLFGMFCEGRHIAEKLGIQLAETGLHFRDRIVDNQLADMAREDAPQMSHKEIEEKIRADLIREREELGMAGGKNVSQNDGEDGEPEEPAADDDAMPPADGGDGEGDQEESGE